ncbi:MAG: hypothetical protein A2Y10_01885 [Planctomycetes bacterium GWF2_41_51]|nr:MAG: hypothetical protein A2Y10_01885 [Planctomycetes bacterium GWF2_41_51]
MCTKTLSLLLCICLLVISGCQESEQTAPPQQAPLAQPVVQPNLTSKIYTCEACPVVRLDTTMPVQVQAGTEFGYTIQVTNLTDEVVTNVIVTDVSASNFQPVRSNPPHVIDQNKIKWIFPEIGPRQTVQIDGVGMASAGGEVVNYIDVTYTAPVRLRTISLQPKIVITKSAPAEISACAPILYIFKVENIGTGPANNLRMYDTLPQGLTTSDGNSSIDITIGSLPAGKSRTYSVALTAARTGTYVNNVVAIADGEVTAESGEVITIVRKPVLQITNTGPETDYVNMETTYNISVTNTGDWPAIDTVIENILPQGMRFVRSQGGNLTDNRVLWKVARLNPGETVNTSVTLSAAALGTIQNTVTASAVCADTVTAIASTEIKGAPGILFEVGDTTDPVRLDNATTYRIVVTNQGSVPVTNIVIKATLDTAMNLVSNVGATKGQVAENGIITFEPLTWLAPRTQAIWEVTVKSINEGDIRFETEMTADQLTSPVMETESTHFFK